MYTYSQNSSGNYVVYKDGSHDVAATVLLNKELIDKVERKNKKASFVNELDKNDSTKKIVNAEKKTNPSAVYYYTDVIINDSDISEGFKAIGGKTARQTDFYHVSFDKKGAPLYKDDKGNDVDGLLRGMYHSDKTMVMHDAVGIFDKSDSKIIETVKKEYDALKIAGSTDIQNQLVAKFGARNYNIFNCYLLNFSNEAEAISGVKSTAVHEINHAKVTDYLKSFDLKPSSEPLSIENEARILEDFEKAGTLDATFGVIEDYFKNGEDLETLNNYTTTNNLYETALKIKRDALSSGKSEDEAKEAIKEYLTDYPKIACDIALSWDNDLAVLYKGVGSNNSIEEMLTDWANSHPCYKIGIDDSISNEEYLKRRKLCHQYRVYNPDTKKHEPFNAAEHIPHAEISSNFQSKVVDPLKKRVANRQSYLNPEMLDMLKEINDKHWDDALVANDVDDHVLKVDKYNPHTPTPGGPTPASPPEPYIAEYRAHFEKYATDNGYGYSEDKTTGVYTGIIEKADGAKTYVQATSNTNVAMGAVDKDGKDDIPDYKDFVALAQKAKKQGAPISLGNIEDAEFKARLYAACLENGVDVTNPPKADELENVSVHMKTKILRHTIKDKAKLNAINNTPERKEINKVRQTLRDAKKDGVEYASTTNIATKEKEYAVNTYGKVTDAKKQKEVDDALKLLEARKKQMGR